MSTRMKKLQWKEVKNSFICGLHFEANLFKGKNQYRVDFSKAIADLNASESPTAPPQPGPGPAPPQSGPAPPQSGPATPQPGSAPPQSVPAPPQSGSAPPQSGPAPPQPGSVFMFFLIM